MGKEFHINSSAVISNNVIYKNGDPAFKGSGGSLTDFLVAAYRHFDLQYLKFFKMDTLSRLGWLANEVMLKDSFDKEKYKVEDVGIVLMNANASLDTDAKYYETTKAIPSPAQFVYTLPNIVIGEISIRHGFKGENAFFISKEFDAGFLVQYVSNLLESNIMECCICGWVDVLGEHYNATLFLVEKDKRGDSVNFAAESVEKLRIKN